LEKQVNQKIVIILINALFLLTGACRSTDAPSPVQPTGTEQSSPSSVEAFVSPILPISPLATPAVASELEAELAAPKEGFGSVGGILLMKNPHAEGTLTPVSIAPIFLAPLLYAEDGKFAFAGLDQDRDPATSTSPTGVFVFQNVPVGQYGLIVMYGVELYVVANEQGENYIITIEADKAINLGEIHTNLPSL
jgi:hypothetical protein